MSLVPQTPSPQFVMSADAVRLATYEQGDPAAPTVLAVHGFASSAQVNWYATGWVRELLRAGYRVLVIDQRGHGLSDKPRDPAAYSMQRLVDDVASILDAYLIDEVAFIGYSLGARVGWHAALALGERITKAVLGGIPDGLPLTRFRVDEARAHLATGKEISDRITRAYVQMASRTETNELPALVALVEGMQDGLQPDPRTPPAQPVLFATGSEDGILAASKRLAAATPTSEFFEVPGRNHFNAPTSKDLRERAIQFLAAPSPEPSGPDHILLRAHPSWTSGLAALLYADQSRQGRSDVADLEQRLAADWPQWEACLRRAGELDLLRNSRG